MGHCAVLHNGYCEHNTLLLVCVLTRTLLISIAVGSVMVFHPPFSPGHFSPPSGQLLYHLHCLLQGRQPSCGLSLFPGFLPLCLLPGLSDLVVLPSQSCRPHPLSRCHHWSGPLCPGHTLLDTPCFSLLSGNPDWLLNFRTAPLPVPAESAATSAEDSPSGTH